MAPAASRCCTALLSALLLTAGLAPLPAEGIELPFEAPASLSTTGDGAASVHAADLDGDGDLDAISASALDDTVAWYENTGGAFGAAQAISAVAGGVVSIATADLDHDGDLDVLAACPDDDAIRWYENGAAWMARDITTGADGASSVAVGDIDGDGLVDVVVSSENDDRVAWFESDGAMPPGFTERVIDVDPDGAGGSEGFADGPRAAIPADVDGDGDLDVVTASVGDDTVAWFENTAGDGLSWTPDEISTATTDPTAVAAADVDGDGSLDVFSADAGSGEVSWHRNTAGDGSAWTLGTVTPSASGAAAVFAIDLDVDGDVDALAAAEVGDTVAWYENTAGDGSLWSAHTLDGSADGARGVFAADLDDDGDLDALAASSEDDTVAWIENTSIRRNAPFDAGTAVESAADHARSVYAADLDGDGDLDMIGAAERDDLLAWYENDGVGGFGPRQVITFLVDGAYSVSAADIDGDGDLDVFSAARNDNRIDWFENDGMGGFGPRQLVSLLEIAVSRVGSADVDRDGDIDLLSASGGDDTIAWHENTAGDGSGWTTHAISTSADVATGVATADIDGDGDLDVASSSANDDKIAWYESDGASPPSFVEHVVTEDPDGPDPPGGPLGIQGFADFAHSVGTADLDGDGDVDLFSTSAGNKTVAWYENTAGDGSTWSPQVICACAIDARDAFAADFDQDGDLDVLAASKDDNTVAWHENTAGDGSAWIEHFVTTDANKAYSVFAADLDGDGDIDALAAVREDDEFAWYENLGGQFALPTAAMPRKAFLQDVDHALLSVSAAHRGRAGDADVELVSIELLFEESEGDPLSDAEASALIDNVAVYRDDGSGVFESGSDTLAGQFSSFALSAGVQSVLFTDGDPVVTLLPGASATFFVVVTLTADAAIQTPAFFRVTHRTESSSVAEDADADVPLRAEFSADTTAEVGYISTTTSDFDEDGLLDIYETETGVYVSPTDTGTDPLRPDTDGDGWPDGTEVSVGTDPNDPEDFTMVPAAGPLTRVVLALALLAASPALRGGRRPRHPH